MHWNEGEAFRWIKNSKTLIRDIYQIKLKRDILTNILLRS